MFTELIIKEANAEINPLNEYIKHTLKAFILHLKQKFGKKDRKS